MLHTITTRTSVDSFQASLLIGGGGPLLIGLIWTILGVAKWSGIWKRWYESPSAAWASVKVITGWSPLPQLLIGVGFCFVGGALFAMFVFPSAPLAAAVIGSTLLVAGAVFVFYRPHWIYPTWMRQEAQFGERH